MVDINARPVALSVKPRGIPDAMKTEARWALWRYELRDGVWSKTPYRVNGQQRAKSNDASTWTTFAIAIDAYFYSDQKFDGLLFALGDDWAGMDLDDCYDAETNVISKPALNIIKSIGEHYYCEFSPGNAGVKVVGHAARNGGEIKFAVKPPKHITWHGARFITITGRTGHSTRRLVDLTAVIDALFPASIPIGPASDVPDYIKLGDTRGWENYVPPIPLTEEQALTHALDARDSKFYALWFGDWRELYASQSEADSALCFKLAFWTAKDTVHMDRLFRRSGLMRPKWDELRGAQTYGQKTIATAIARQTDVYVPLPVADLTKVIDLQGAPTW
jgi:putative DNA primase/helicase